MRAAKSSDFDYRIVDIVDDQIEMHANLGCLYLWHLLQHEPAATGKLADGEPASSTSNRTGFLPEHRSPERPFDLKIVDIEGNVDLFNQTCQSSATPLS